MKHPSDLLDNPFLVLDIPASATRIEVERAGQKLLAQLAVRVASVMTYRTPGGVQTRDEDKVRAALSALRDPEQRVLHELWANLPPSDEEEESEQPIASWPSALRSLGWRRPCRE